MSSLQKGMMKSRLGPGLPLPSSHPRPNRHSQDRKLDYGPVSWKQYFERSETIQTDRGQFRVYLSAEPDKPERPRIVVLHGGGYSALSWSLFTAEITQMVHCQVVAIDFRGHGSTSSQNDDDLSAETLSDDVSDTLMNLFSEFRPPIVLIGHSMGGAIAVRVAGNPKLELTVQGLAVIDVVEGTAMESLSSMQSFLRGRPTHFKSVEHAIEWCVRSGQTRNMDSARVSMPGQIIDCKTETLASENVENKDDNSDSEDSSNSLGPPAKRHIGITDDSISEDDENPHSDTQSATFRTPSAHTTRDTGKNYTWRINLSQTEKHWTGWFKGLSSAFLSCSALKLLLLASITGLDRELTVGQMQGKFQMQVLTRCGHAVHEDCPEEVAQVIASFLLRHKFTESRMENMTLKVMPGC